MRALGVNPSMTQRQKQQLLDDANEVLEASPHTHVGGTDYASGNFSRVRDRQVVAEAMKPLPPRLRTESELAGEAGLAMHERWEREKRATEQARIAAQQKRLADEKAAKERKARQAQIAFHENLVLHEISDLSSDENQMFWDQFASRDATDAQAASIIAEEIRSRRKV